MQSQGASDGGMVRIENDKALLNKLAIKTDRKYGVSLGIGVFGEEMAADTQAVLWREIECLGGDMRDKVRRVATHGTGHLASALMDRSSTSDGRLFGGNPPLFASRVSIDSILDLINELCRRLHPSTNGIEDEDSARL